MRRLAGTALRIAIGLAFAACSLNPQPYPPASLDPAGMDASVDSGAFDSDGGTDAAVTAPDSGFADASVDAGAPDGSLDASTDATGDATGDAISD